MTNASNENRNPNSCIESTETDEPYCQSKIENQDYQDSEPISTVLPESPVSSLKASVSWIPTTETNQTNILEDVFGQAIDTLSFSPNFSPPNFSPISKINPFLRSSSPPHSSSKPLLLLDLDGTLAMTASLDSSNLYPPPDFRFLMGTEPTNGWQRPYLEEFLIWANQHFNVYIWTASFGGYAKSVLECITKKSPLLQTLNSSSNFCKNFTSIENETKNENENENENDHKIVDFTNIHDDLPIDIPVLGIFEKDECEIEWKGAAYVTKNLSSLLNRHFPDVETKDVVVVDNDFYTFRLNQSNAIPINTYWGQKDDDELKKIKDFLETIYLPAENRAELDLQFWNSDVVMDLC